MSDTSATRGPATRAGGVLSKPSTRLGWWSFALAVTFVLLMVVNSAVFMNLADDAPWRQTVLPVFGISMMLCGLVSGVLALVAMVKQHERSLLVWLPLAMGAFVVFFVVGEFAFPH